VLLSGSLLLFDESNGLIRKELEFREYEWLTCGPALKKTKISFFNNENCEGILFFPVHASEKGKLCIQDLNRMLFKKIFKEKPNSFSLSIRDSEIRMTNNGTATVFLCDGNRLVPSKILYWIK
jgi:hypothetical protein